MIIYRKEDKVSVKIDDIEIKISPLTHSQKSELQSHMMKAVNGDMDEAMVSVQKSLKFAIKDIKGVFYMDGSDKREYSLSFNDDGFLSDECIDELLNLPISNKISSVCSALLQGVPDKILDKDGKEIEGIKVLTSGGKKPKKK